MSFADFLNKYRQVPETEVQPTSGRGVTRANTLAEQQGAAMRELAVGESSRLAATEQLTGEDRRQRALQSNFELQQLRNENTSQKQKYNQVTQQLSSDLKRNLTNLSEREKLDQMEGVAASMRLQDEKYAYQLADEGRRRRLSDGMQFDLALKESVFDDEIDLIRNDYKFKKVMDMDDASFQQFIADIDIASAIALAGQQLKDKNQTSIISGLGTAGTQAAGYYFGREPTQENTQQIKPRATYADVGNIDMNTEMA